MKPLRNHFDIICPLKKNFFQSYLLSDNSDFLTFQNYDTQINGHKYAGDMYMPFSINESALKTVREEN